ARDHDPAIGENAPEECRIGQVAVLVETEQVRRVHELVAEHLREDLRHERFASAHEVVLGAIRTRAPAMDLPANVKRYAQSGRDTAESLGDHEPRLLA